MSIMEASAVYRRGSPLRANSKAYQEDLKTIKNDSRPTKKAEQLVKQRNSEKIEETVTSMLRDLQGRRKRYRYDQSAACQLEHIVDHPLDPVTQVPIWRELLRITKERPTDRDTFMHYASAILSQHSFYDPATA